MESGAPKEFEERVIQLNRVSKKTTGGSSLSFTALVVLGNRNGRVGYAHGKAKDVTQAINKATTAAKRNIQTVKVKDGTIAHEIRVKDGATRLMLKPAPKGTGIIAGGALRHVLELAGVKDISTKMYGSGNKLTCIRATVKALRSLKG